MTSYEFQWPRDGIPGAKAPNYHVVLCDVCKLYWVLSKKVFQEKPHIYICPDAQCQRFYYHRQTAIMFKNLLGLDI